MTRFIKTLVAVALALVLMVVPCAPIGLNAHAAYTQDLMIWGESTIELETGKTKTLKYEFSGLGIAALSYCASDNLDVAWHDSYWVYPGVCHIYADITLKGVGDGYVKLFLKDEDGNYPKYFTTNIVEDKAEVVFENIMFDKVIEAGKGYHLQGSISSDKVITKVTAEVYCEGSLVKSASAAPNSCRYNLYNSDIDWGIPFGFLTSGKYILVYSVTSGNREYKSTEYAFEVKPSSSNSTATNSKLADELYAVAKKHVGNNYKPYKGGSTTPWCGFAARTIFLETLRNLGYSEKDAKSAIGYNYMGGTLTTAYAYSHYDIGTFRSFSYWSYTFYSGTIGETVTAEGKNEYSSDTFTPKVGSIALIETNGKIANDGPDHVALIVKVNEDGSFVTIEGNSGSGSTATRTVKMYTYYKAKYGSVVSWRRNGCSGKTCLVLGICEPKICG